MSATGAIPKTKRKTHEEKWDVGGATGENEEVFKSQQEDEEWADHVELAQLEWNTEDEEGDTEDEAPVYEEEESYPVAQKGAAIINPDEEEEDEKWFALCERELEEEEFRNGPTLSLAVTLATLNTIDDEDSYVGLFGPNIRNPANYLLNLFNLDSAPDPINWKPGGLVNLKISKKITPQVNLRCLLEILFRDKKLSRGLHTIRVNWPVYPQKYIPELYCCSITHPIHIVCKKHYTVQLGECECFPFKVIIFGRNPLFKYDVKGFFKRQKKRLGAF